MKLIRNLSFLIGAAVALGLSATLPLAAQETPDDPPALPSAPTAVEAESAEAAQPEPESVETESSSRVERRYTGEKVSVGSDVLLAADERASEAVAVMGDVVVDGDVDHDAVAVMGDVTVNGRVGNAAVAVLGDVVINGEVNHEVVAVLGRVQLGPEAHVRGDIVAVGGVVDRAPGARIDGAVQNIPIFGNADISMDWLKAWVRHCLLLGRPLWFHEDLGWAWMLAGTALLIYAFLALILPRPVVKCVRTMETRPGMSVVTALLTIFIAPLAFIVLSFTIVGGLLLGIVMFFVGIFGKAVFLAWLGRRFTRTPENMVPVVAVLLGGLITTAIYLVPVLGFAFQKLSGVLGTGIVIYTLILGMQSDRNRTKPAVATAAVPPPPARSAEAAAVATEPPAMAETDDAVQTPPPITTPPPVPPRTDPMAQPSTLPRAGFWARLGATLIDVILLAIVLNFADSRAFEPSDYFPLLAAIYFIVMWGLKGTTIGGIVLGLKVVRVDDKPVDWSVAIVRGLGAFLSLFVLGLGFVWVAFDPERQSWHDKIAGTTVVHVPKGVSLI